MGNIETVFELQLVDEQHQHLLSQEKVLAWVIAALGGDVVKAEITIRIVDEEEGAELNEAYRGKAYATNVLTFDYTHAPDVSADLVICAPVVEREAGEQDKSLESHYAHMVVHGLLHAQGWDHEDDDEAKAMEALEIKILNQLGFPSPYES